MHCSGSTALWLHTLRTSPESMTWAEFTSSACLKFDRDEHNHLLRQFFHIRQSTSVSDFIECFSEIVHQLLVHDPTIASFVITNHFVDGLKEEIHSVIMVHRQQDLDTAGSLALL